MFRFFRLLTLSLCLLALGAAATPPTEATVYTKRGEVIFRLETATTPQMRKVGLMNRDTLKPHDGMLFVFPRSGVYRFWMKNTRIPLDMIFIDTANTIADIKTARPHTLTSQVPRRAVIAVIELDAGRAAKEGIAVGDVVRYVLPKDSKIE